MIPLLYFASVSKFTSSADGWLTENDNTSDKVMFALAVCANEMLLMIETVMNAIRKIIFFIGDRNK